jgi:hypothetical protein
MRKYLYLVGRYFYTVPVRYHPRGKKVLKMHLVGGKIFVGHSSELTGGDVAEKEVLL